MHTKTTPGLAFDSLCPAKGSFKVTVTGEVIEELSITMVYTNKATMETFGSADWPMGVWSEETLEAFKTFLRSSEKDVAKVLYGERDDSTQLPRQPHAWEQAETGEPLTKPRGIGGT